MAARVVVNVQLPSSISITAHQYGDFSQCRFHHADAGTCLIGSMDDSCGGKPICWKCLRMTLNIGCWAGISQLGRWAVALIHEEAPRHQSCSLLNFVLAILKEGDVSCWVYCIDPSSTSFCAVRIPTSCIISTCLVLWRLRPFDGHKFTIFTRCCAWQHYL